MAESRSELKHDPGRGARPSPQGVAYAILPLLIAAQSATRGVVWFLDSFLYYATGDEQTSISKALAELSAVRASLNRVRLQLEDGNVLLRVALSRLRNPSDA